MIELEITPTPKPRMTKSDRWESRPCVNRYWSFKEELNLILDVEDLPECCWLIFLPSHA